ncbi:MAG: hypothetical protein HC850_18205 [Rhodomicrobium sp.]|nr:hypothetical protein [Rhodomicrobium sp.]
MLDAFPSECRKYSVDPMTPYAGAGVTPVRADFLEWRPPEPIEIATCFQVMEHVREPQKFAARLLEVAEVTIVSVPYKEAPGLNPGHLHSMIDEDTVAEWFGRRPNYAYIAHELDGGDRIISVFDGRAGERWPTLCGHCEHGLRFRYRWSMRGAPPAFAEFE